MRRVCVIYEDEDRTHDLVTALLEAGVPPHNLVRWYVGNGGAFDVHAAPDTSMVYFSRLSASAGTRKHDVALPFAHLLLQWLQLHNCVVINGLSALELEVSKVRQVWALRGAGIATPPTLVFAGKTDILSLTSAGGTLKMSAAPLSDLAAAPGPGFEDCRPPSHYPKPGGGLGHDGGGGVQAPSDTFRSVRRWMDGYSTSRARLGPSRLNSGMPAVGVHEEHLPLVDRKRQRQVAQRAVPAPTAVVYLKPNTGGSGSDVHRFESSDHFAAELRKSRGVGYRAPASVFAVQGAVEEHEEFWAKNKPKLVGAKKVFYRAEFVNQQLLYVLRIATPVSVNTACPKCDAPNRHDTSFSVLPDPVAHFGGGGSGSGGGGAGAGGSGSGSAAFAEFVARCAAFMVAHRLHVTAFEFSCDWFGATASPPVPDSVPVPVPDAYRPIFYVYDVNTNVNYNKAAEAAACAPSGMAAIAHMLKTMATVPT